MPDKEPCLSGTLLIGQMQAAREILGAPVVAAALERLSPELQGEVAELLPIGWVRTSTQDAVLEALSAESGRSVVSIHTEAVTLSQRRNFRTLYKLALRVVSMEALMRRVPALYRRQIDTGRVEAEVTEPGRGRLKLRGWGAYPGGPGEARLRGMEITIRVVLQQTGRKSVAVSRRPHPEGADFLIRW